MPQKPEPAVELRPAKAGDQGRIDRLIRAAGINPFGLDWERFTVAETADGYVVGCGQLKEHRDGSLELASLAVAEGWRGRGIGGGLIRALIAQADQQLWLMCRSGLVPLYEKFGFQSVPPDGQQPPYFRRVRTLARIYHRVANRDQFLAVMTRPASAEV
jgi:N-acetylglutamate synthase-like GNAT family acetyltransferase